MSERAQDRNTGIARGWTVLVDGLAALGTVLVGVLMAIICADVVARTLMGASLPMVSELGALALVMIVYLQLATTIRHDRLARADFIFGPLQASRPRAAALLGAAFDLAGLAMLTLIALSSLQIVLGDLSNREYIGVTGVMTLPTWPFRALIVLGIATAAVEFLLRTVQGLRRAAGGGR
jgi:TRAP-type mannitol/chloroaromatic compound transport system permease small subunit